MSQFTDSEYAKIIELTLECDEFHCFVYKGLLIRGNETQVIKQYIKQNSSKKFYVWLIDTNLVIDENIIDRELPPILQEQQT